MFYSWCLFLAIVVAFTITADATPLDRRTSGPLGAYCGANMWNPQWNPTCHFPVQGSWPRTQETTSRPVPGGPLVLFISPNMAMPAIQDLSSPNLYVVVNATTGEYANNFIPTHLSQSVNDWFNPAINPPTLPEAVTFPIPSCASDIRPVLATDTEIITGPDGEGPIYAGRSTTSQSAAFGRLGVYETPPECSTLLFHYQPICAPVAANMAEMHCSGTASGDINSEVSCAFITPGAPRLVSNIRPAYSGGGTALFFGITDIPVPLDFVSERFASASYSPQPRCAEWGRDYGLLLANALQMPFADTRGLGIYDDQGSPGPFTGTVTWLRGTCQGTSTIFGDPVPHVALVAPGLYNRNLTAPVLVETRTARDEFAYDVQRPYMSRIFDTEGLVCTEDAPRPQGDRIARLDRLVFLQGSCRVNMPYNLSEYGSLTAEYLNATGGIYQPGNLSPTTIVLTYFVTGLPSDFFQIYAQFRLNQSVIGPNPTEVLLLDLIPANLYIGNGFYLQIGINVQNIGPFVSSRGKLDAKIFHPTEPFTRKFDLVQDLRWLPACRCTDSDLVEPGQVKCVNNEMVMFAGIPHPEFIADVAINQPVCTIAPDISTPFYLPGVLLRGDEYKFIVTITENNHPGQVTYQWYITNMTVYSSYSVLDASLATSRVRFNAVGSARISAVVSYTTSKITTTCDLPVQIYHPCPQIALAASSTRIDLNSAAVLEASVPAPPDFRTAVLWSWSLLYAVPPSAASSITFNGSTTARVVRFSATEPGVYAVLGRVTGIRPGSFPSCSTGQAVVIEVFNASSPPFLAPNPDFIVLNSSCFDNLGNVTDEIPPVSYLDGVPQTQLQFQPVQPSDLDEDQSFGAAEFITRISSLIMGQVGSSKATGATAIDPETFDTLSVVIPVVLAALVGVVIMYVGLRQIFSNTTKEQRKALYTNCRCCFSTRVSNKAK